METVEDKENVAPLVSSDPLRPEGGTPSPRKPGRRGRSKSIGPGGLEEGENGKEDAKNLRAEAKNRRKSTYVATAKSIISNDTEKAERQAARRKTLANRRVSFAPEATLHTWDVIEFMRDPTTSTDSSESTRRASNVTRSSGGGSPFKGAHAPDSDPLSTPPEQVEGPNVVLNSPAHQRDLHQKKHRRSSGIPPLNFNNPDDAFDSSSDSDSDAFGEGAQEEEGSDDETGTAMSLDIGDNTAQSVAESESSTGSSARLEAALRQAAHTAGTRGIEYDEYGDDVSMEFAGQEITDAFKPFAEQHENDDSKGSASFDQENVNPFSPAFKAKLISGLVTRPSTVPEEDTGDLSMDVTRAVGGITQAAAPQRLSSPMDDGTMEFTQAVGKINNKVHTPSPGNRSGQKRRRSTTDTGSPGGVAGPSQPKRRRSSVARSSMGDDTMDLTVAMGGVKSGSPVKLDRRKSVGKRRSSGATSEQEEATMEFTQAVGGIKPYNRTEHTSSSFDENEELTMELTTVMGGIRANDEAAIQARPVTPQTSLSPLRSAANATPKDQERFKDAPYEGPRKLLTPIFQKQVMHSTDKKSSAKPRKSISPVTHSPMNVVFTQPPQEKHVSGSTQDPGTSRTTPPRLLEKSPVTYPKLPLAEAHISPLEASPMQSPTRRISVTPESALKQQLDAQLQAPETSPTIERQQRSSPARVPATPEKAVDEPIQEGRRLAESIKLMSTPRKETLRNITPKKSNPSRQNGHPKVATPKTRPTPREKQNSINSPAKQLSSDMDKIQQSQTPAEKIELQNFLDVAGIRFMDLTTTRRRMTTAPTPSKARRAGAVEEEDPVVDCGSAIVAGGCTVPELEMYEHACHELKRYISDGKRVIKELENETARENPPLIQAYVSADYDRKTVMDAQMRDIKTHARLRSKEMWYAWRSQLLEDLMKGLQGIAEGLIKDDEILLNAEQMLDQVLPSLVERHEKLQAEAGQLELEAASTSKEEREELDSARERLQAANVQIQEKEKLLEELQREADEQATLANDLEENRAEFEAAIKEADRVKEACRGVSLNEISSLKESIRQLEETSGWTIASASSSPPTVTMTYKSDLELFFHPSAFAVPTSNIAARHPPSNSNRPISLTYLPSHSPGTTLRFFLQLVRASLQALPQRTTGIADLLRFVSTAWDAALSAAEAERRLDLEGPTASRIVSDERLSIESTLLIPQTRTKVRVAFGLTAAVGGNMRLGTTAEPSIVVVYGERYPDQDMKGLLEILKRAVGKDGGSDGWDGGVREVRNRLLTLGSTRRPKPGPKS